MGDNYAECRKSHAHMSGNVDGCQEFKESSASPLECEICGCNRNFHRKVKPKVEYKKEVVYTKCHRIRDFKIPNSVDGCQEFIPTDPYSGKLICDACKCHRNFHRNEINVPTTVTSPH